jgi:hypothetical protein
MLFRVKSSKEPAVEKFAGVTMSPFKISPLPKLSGTRFCFLVGRQFTVLICSGANVVILGVFGLSTLEIKEDLHELHPPSDANDTDSDCSVISDDILDSVYPVQPRSAPRAAMQLQDYLNSSQNVTSEEAMFVIKDIAKAHQELMEKEKLREDWEMRTEVHRTRSLCRILLDCAHSYGIPCTGLRV